MAQDITSISNVAALPASTNSAAASYANPVAVPAPVKAEQAKDRPSDRGQDQAASASVREIVKAHLKATNSDLRFETDEETGQSIISVVDHETGKVLRQIPGEEEIRLAQVLEKLAKGEIEDTA